MDEKEIRRIVREECMQIMNDEGLRDEDVIIKYNAPSEIEVVSYGFSYLETFKKVDQLAIMIGKIGARVIKIFVFVLGLWSATQFASMLAFEKRLPDAVDLAQKVRKNSIEITYNVFDKNNKSTEKWIVVSPSWERYNDKQYKTMAREYLDGTRSPDEMYVTATQFIPVSGAPIDVINNSSSLPEDFKV